MFRCSTISILTFSFVSAITHVTAHGQLTIGANIQSNSLTPALASEPTLPQSNQTNLTNLTNFQGVLVVVNDTPITDTDLAFRLNLDLATANTPNTNENRALFAQRSLDNLILDTIKITEAEQNDIVVSDTDIQRGLVDIAAQNGQNITEFLADLQRQGIPPSTLVRLIRAQFAWRAITAAALSNEPAILAEDIDAEISRLNSLRGRRERLLTEIFLPYSLYGNQAETQRAARELVGEIKAGTRFADLARQHSYASSAANGGRVGWVADWGQSGDNQKVTFLESGSTSRTSINSDADHGALVELGLDYTTYNFTDTSMGIYARSGVVLWGGDRGTSWQVQGGLNFRF